MGTRLGGGRVTLTSGLADRLDTFKATEVLRVIASLVAAIEAQVALNHAGFRFTGPTLQSQSQSDRPRIHNRIAGEFRILTMLHEAGI